SPESNEGVEDVSLFSQPILSGNSSKQVNISWDEVDREFNMILSEDEVLEKWNSMESKLKSGNNRRSIIRECVIDLLCLLCLFLVSLSFSPLGIRGLLRTIFPKIVSMASDAKVSGNCSAGIL